MDDSSEEKIAVSVTERTVVSLQVVVIIIGVVIWLIRLSDKADQTHKDFAAFRDEIRHAIKHCAPKSKIDSEDE